MNEEFLRRIQNASSDDVKPLNKGYTNKNTLVRLDQTWYVLRQPYPDASRIVRFHHEAKALQKIAQLDLDVPTLYFDPATGIKVTLYIDALKTYDECDAVDKIERTARLMKKLHGLNATCGFAFDPVARYRQYASHVDHPIYDTKFAENVIEELLELESSPTLCHNDWVAGNIGFTNERDYLIDYEYAGDNDPLFDVMSFLTENQIEDQPSRDRFYLEYFGEVPDEKTKHALACYETFHNLLWCTWAMMMHESRGDAIYAAIAKDKYEALKRNYNL